MIEKSEWQEAKGASDPQTTQPDLWLIGSHDDVGVRTAVQLAKLAAFRIVLARRDATKAASAAASAGGNVRGTGLDILPTEPQERIDRAAAAANFVEACPPDLPAAIATVCTIFIGISADANDLNNIADRTAGGVHPDCDLTARPKRCLRDHCWVVLALWITGIFVLIADASWLKYLSYRRFLHKVLGIMSTALPVAVLQTPLQVMHCIKMEMSFFVASTSGLAVLSMPILAPVIDFAEVSRTLSS